MSTEKTYWTSLSRTINYCVEFGDELGMLGEVLNFVDFRRDVRYSYIKNEFVDIYIFFNFNILKESRSCARVS